jgi:hypothetical protein
MSELDVERLAAALALIERLAEHYHSSTHGNGRSFKGCSNRRCWNTRHELAALAEAHSAAPAEPVMSVAMSDADEGPE